MIFFGTSAASHSSAAALCLILCGFALGLATIDDALTWIYQFLGWLTGQILAPLETVTNHTTPGFQWAWAWINAAGNYTFSFTQWVVLRSHEWWEAWIRPGLYTLWAVSLQYRDYLLGIGDRLLAAAHATVEGSVLGLIIAGRGSLTGVELLHGGFLAARAPFLRLADLLDTQLYALELRVTASTRDMLGKANELISWLNLAFHPSGVFRWEPFVWGVYAYTPDVVAVITSRLTRGDGDAQAARLADRFPPRTAAQAVALFHSGALATKPGMLRAVSIFTTGAPPA